MLIRSVLVAVALVTSLSDQCFGQVFPPPTAQRDAISKLDFLVGQWAGEGWAEVAPGKRAEFEGTENVQSKCDKVLVTIDGLHQAKAGGNAIGGRNAFAVISYDPNSKQYRFQGFTSRGNHEDTTAEVSDNKLVWGMTIPQFGDVRYTITLDDQGRWFDIGEVNRDGKWQKFFEMTLEKGEAK